MTTLDLTQIHTYLRNLQNKICAHIEAADGSATFAHDNWHNEQVVTGDTRIISNGACIEHGAVNFSHVTGHKLPGASNSKHSELAGASFEAIGLSLIMHPLNPYVPTTHFNIRFFIARPHNAPAVWWFGGGYDLTPYYTFIEDCIHWHQTAANACQPFGEQIYTKFKQACDQYFYLPHRQETRGVGGIFFDDLNCWSFERCFAFMQSIGNSFVSAYLPIVNKRQHTPYTERERDFQLYRRGRYVEFNLIYDRGTLFGLQLNGRAESILASLPPLVKWRYDWQPEVDSPEAKLHEFLKPRAWL